mmetsp:Transcript_23690/g.59448  ORF Transcript_23690/g.59448 Transcript_23690/m.59448 type:complete len:214 (-) Transcript_23690:507-1148(-)
MLDTSNLKRLKTLGLGSDAVGALMYSSTQLKLLVWSRSPDLPFTAASSTASSVMALVDEGVATSLDVTTSCGLLDRVRLSKFIDTADPVHVSPFTQKVMVLSPEPAFTAASRTDVTSHSYQLLLEVTLVTDILLFLLGPLFHVTDASAQPVDPVVSNTAIAPPSDREDTYSLSFADRTSACEEKLDASNLKMLTMLCSPSVASGALMYISTAP